MDLSSDKFKELFAESTAKAFRAGYPEVYASVGDEQVFNDAFVLENIEKPKDSSMGRFALPVFRYGKLLGGKPQDIAAKIAAETNERSDDSSPCKSEPAGGFINVRVDPSELARDTIGKVFKQGSHYGDSDIGQNKKYLIEYCSANIAKPYGVGHLRSTIIGNSLRRVYKKLGYDAIGINYLGDWGTQFGKMIVAFRRWGQDVDLENDAVRQLLDLYVRFHDEAKTDPALDDEARKAFKALEDAEPDAVKLWERFKEISLAEFDRIHTMLGVEFDIITGESFLNDKMEPLIERLQKAGLTETSQGALIVQLDDPNLPPCLLKKGDGATLYATRDLAGLVYRWETYHFHESLYVVGSAQMDHFKQAFKVISMLEDAENMDASERMTGRVKHIDFGWVKFEGGAMATRSGNIIFLEEVTDRAVALAREKILEKNPSLEAIDRTAHQIGVGAVIFSQFSVRRQKDVNFIWEEVLSFEGETGPYLQYTHARLCSLLRKYDSETTGDIDFSLLIGDEEQRVVEILADFPSIVEDAARTYDPHLIAGYLLKTAAAFNKVYQRKSDDGRIDKIISEDKKLSEARMALVKSVQTVLSEGLYLLGIDTPEEM
jgi:arginyl-tRNA synthetase